MNGSCAKEFLQRLHGRLDRTTDGVVAWMHKAPGGRVETLYAPPSEVPPRVVQWSAGNVWVSVATFLGRRACDNAVCVPALWVDLDPQSAARGELAGWQRAAHQKLMAFVPSPSLVVFSGRGYHGYWLFAEPVRVRDGVDRARQVVEANKMLERRLGGDSVSDLARVMRVPGTLNPKTNARCRLLVEDGPIYDVDGLISALDVVVRPVDAFADTSSVTVSGAGGTAFVPAQERTRSPRRRGRPSLGVTVRDLRGLPAWARVLVVGGVWSAKGRYRRPGGLDRSRADLAAVGAMVRAGWPDTRVVAAFGRRDWLIGARYRELGTRGLDYLRRTISKARQREQGQQDNEESARRLRLGAEVKDSATAWGDDNLCYLPLLS